MLTIAESVPPQESIWPIPELSPTCIPSIPESVYRFRDFQHCVEPGFHPIPEFRLISELQLLIFFYHLFPIYIYDPIQVGKSENWVKEEWNGIGRSSREFRTEIGNTYWELIFGHTTLHVSEEGGGLIPVINLDDWVKAELDEIGTDSRYSM
jgi:hypothetical protein